MSGYLSIFRGRRVLITGDTGFKGSWLALWLNELGADVTGIALPPEGERPHFSLLGLDNLIRHVDGDIREKDTVTRVFEDCQPEIVFHLAAQSLVRLSYEEPKRTFDTNIGGSVNVLEAVREQPCVRSLVFITSDKCYRNQEWTWGYREGDELGGRDPYSASKASAELVFSAYRESFFGLRPDLGAASARAGNVIGGGDWARDRIVPDCVRALTAGRPIVLRNPEATRPWQHVLDPLSGYLQLAAGLFDEPKRYSGAWNFGPLLDGACTVGELADRMVADWGSGATVVDQSQDAPHESRLLHLNIDKAQLELGWRPRWDLPRTIAETVSWYRKTEDGAAAGDVSRAQINAHMEA